MQPDQPWDNHEIRRVLDRPAAFYHDYASRPCVAEALSNFRSERDVHQTERLDLVTWVQYICGFGCEGPSEDAWTQLFNVCRVPQQLYNSHEASSDMLNTGEFLREHEIAVLLAHAKVSPEASDAMTHAALIKHRIRPAVFGRNDARTPGIIKHVRAKFEDWILGYMTRWMCHYTVQEFSPSSFLPGFEDISMFNADSQQLKSCADAHAAKNVKDWGDVVMNLLEIDQNTTSPRAYRFEQKVGEIRDFLYLQFYNKITEYWFNSIYGGAALLPLDTRPRHYRSVAVAPSDCSADEDALLSSACAQQGGKGARLTKEAYGLVKLLCNLRRAPCLVRSQVLVEARIRMFELHAPRPFGEVSLKLLSADDVKRHSISLITPTAEDSTGELGSAAVLLGDFRSPLRKTEIHGAPPSQRCRALELIVRVALLPPRQGDRPEIRAEDIIGAEWVDLEESQDKCEELDALQEMGMEFDEECESMKSEEDEMQKWLSKCGVSNALASAQACGWRTEHVCTGLKKYAYKVKAPRNAVARLRKASNCDETNMAIDTTTDSVSDMGICFDEHCWIDCHTGAQISYKTAAGVELSAVSSDRKWLFERAPRWRWRLS